MHTRRYEIEKCFTGLTTSVCRADHHLHTQQTLKGILIRIKAFPSRDEPDESMISPAKITCCNSNAGGKNVDPRNNKEKAFDAAAAQWSKRKKLAVDHNMLPQTREKARHLETVRTGGRCSVLSILSAFLGAPTLQPQRTVLEQCSDSTGPWLFGLASCLAYTLLVFGQLSSLAGGRIGMRIWMQYQKHSSRFN